MGKERELLKRVRDTLHELKETHYDLYWDIQTALDQPEQEHVGIVRTIGGYPDESDHIAEWTCSFKYLKDGDRLYLAPPKCELLDDKVISHGLIISNEATHAESFWAGVKFAETKHGIGE